MKGAAELLRFSGAVECDPAIDRWFDMRPSDLGAMARTWFARMRRCGGDVRELMHMRHVKLWPGVTLAESALVALIVSAHRDIAARLKLAD